MTSVGPQSLAVVKQQAEMLFDAGKPDKAETLLVANSALLGRDISAWFLLGLAQLQQGKYQDAEQSFLKVLSLNSKIIEAYVNLGMIYKSQEKLTKAERQLKKALELNPGFPPAWQTLGVVFCKKSRYDEGLSCFKRVLSINPKSLDAMHNLGDVFRGKGAYDEAEKYYQQALSVNDSYLPAAIGLSRVWHARKEKDKLSGLLENLLARYPGNIEVASAFGKASQLLEKDEQATTILEDALKNPEVSQRNLSTARFCLGHIYDRRKDYDKAFSCFYKANEPRSGHYKHSGTEETVQRIQTYYSRDYFETLDGDPSSGREFVFIVGMPRSGTSLLEQIIDSHPEAVGAGELIKIGEIASSLSADSKAVPKKKIGSEKRHQLGRLYRSFMFSQLQTKGLSKKGVKETTRFVDKMPFNFLHIGLIITLFPKARIIHAQRHPVATCLSNYFQDFSADIPFSYDLTDLGHYYGQYQNIMQHWKKILGGRLLCIEYESMVENAETSTRKVLDFCELPWNDRCLRFYENKRIVPTASISQVTRPVYTQSVEHWKNYAHRLAPLLESLHQNEVDIAD